MDNISIGTAWLFSQFSAGSGGLLNYNFAGTGGTSGTRTADAGDLQKAIWFLEDEVDGVRNHFIDDAETALGYTHDAAGDAKLKLDSNGAFNVIALNMYSTSPGTTPGATTIIDGVTYYLKQDVLAVVPEPTTMIAGALLLLPFGASTLRALRKNRA
jgi:hypothetical protein